MKQGCRIAIIGAGPGGICMAVKLLAAGLDDFVILERESEVGGTWVNNRYPGLACDVPSVLYSFSFEMKPDWTRAFAQQPEIKAYMQHCAARHGVLPHVRLGTEVRQARWDETASQWQIHTQAGETIVADVLVSALGMFNELQWPDIEGLHDFAGRLIHTGRWPQGTDLGGQRVGVIGSAGTAVQLVPELAAQASQLSVFQRTAAWVMPKKDRTYTEAELAAMRADPSIALKARQEYLAQFEVRLTFDQPELVEEARRQAHANRAAVLDPLTRARLEPQVPLGSQRPLYSNEYYPTFNLPHVELVTDAIERIVPAGVQTRDGRTREFDTLVLATGYAANKFLSVLDVRGRGGQAIGQAWADGAQAYLGITTSGFPNLFMLYGPNTNNGSILTMLELQADYIVQRLRDMREHDLAWIDVRPEVMQDYNAQLQQRIQAVEPWRALGTRYYRASSGRVVTQWPGNMAAYEALTRAGRLDAFETRRSDAAALADHVRQHIGPFEGELSLRRVEGGQSNPTYIVDAGAQRYVLRRKPPGKLLQSAHAVDREYRVLRALAGSAVPVPRARVLCEDDAVLGSAFYLMDFVDGRILTDQTLPGMSPAQRRAHYEELNRVIAALHAVDYRAIGLADFGREGQYVQRQIDRWTRQYRAAQTGEIEPMERLIEWLPAHVPPQSATSLVHGDFRLDNVIFHPTEPRIVAVLDWELSTLGDPLVDFAYHCMTWRLQLGVHRTLAGVDLAPLGIPTEAEHVAAYCARSGRGQDGVIPHWEFYLAFNMFRLASIQQGVARRALDGNAANSKAASVAARVQATASAGWATVGAVMH